MCRLVCAFVVYKPPKTGFLAPRPNCKELNSEIVILIFEMCYLSSSSSSCCWRSLSLRRRIVLRIGLSQRPCSILYSLNNSPISRELNSENVILICEMCYLSSSSCCWRSLSLRRRIVLRIGLSQRPCSILYSLL